MQQEIFMKECAIGAAGTRFLQCQNGIDASASVKPALNIYKTWAWPNYGTC